MTDQPTDHRAQAEQWLEGAEEWAASEHRDTTEAQTKAQTAALIAIGHALLATPEPIKITPPIHHAVFEHHGYPPSENPAT